MSEQVHEMFGRIAGRYDLANDVLSLGLHRLWRRTAVALSGAGRGTRVLDCACGTGELSLAFKTAVGPEGEVLGTDFSAAMLEHAPRKAAARNLDVRFQRADLLALPFSDGEFDVASIGFGIRNVDDPKRGLLEMARVVRPGGRIVVLEFGQPRGLFGALFRFYARHLMPRIGRWVTGDRSAYEYLPETAAAFPSGAQFLALMHDTGVFGEVAATQLLYGTAYVYVGRLRALSQRHSLGAKLSAMTSAAAPTT